jgi:hypothetical protein
MTQEPPRPADSCAAGYLKPRIEVEATRRAITTRIAKGELRERTLLSSWQDVIS